MRVVSTTVERAGESRIRIATVVDVSDKSEGVEGLGSGPNGDTVPDQIVKHLIASTSHQATLRDIQETLDRNQRTVGRQAWTLATNAPDLPKRLRGWVERPKRGLYSLTPAARRLLLAQGQAPIELTRARSRNDRGRPLPRQN